MLGGPSGPDFWVGGGEAHQGPLLRRARRGPTAPFAPVRGWICSMDCIELLKHGHVTNTNELRRRQRTHMETHIAVYGSDHMKPKWHAGLHLPDQIDRDGGVVADTTTNERDNKNCKAFVDQITRLEDFEILVLMRSPVSAKTITDG